MLKSLFFTASFFVALTSFAQQQYVQVENTPFVDVQESTITKFDADGDGDMDVVITGTDDSNAGRCDLFINEGDLNFTQAENTPFPEVQYGDAAAGDVDGNGTVDLFVSGFYELEEVSELYLNDGNGNFTLSDQNIFAPIMNTHAVFFDADGDTDLDLIYSGTNPSSTRTTLLYLNDGNGVFIEDAEANFPGLSTGDIGVADINNDGDLDVLMMGLDNSGDRQVKMYLNDAGNFTELATDFPAMSACSIEFFHANSDNNIDVLLSGSPFGPDFTNVFLNNGDETFTLGTESTFNMAYNCHSTTGDVDDDGDLDVMINGLISPNQTCFLYLNDGNGVFAEDTDNLYSESPSQNGEISFEDFDQDGILEFMITGFSDIEGRIAKLYKLDEPNSMHNIDKGDFSVYPNPSSGILNISTAHKIVSVKVMDSSGKMVIDNAWTNGLVNCENLPIGKYTLVIQTAESQSTQNIIILK